MRPLPLALLLALFAASIAISVSASRDSYSDTPQSPSIVRIYYDEIADLAGLSAYDLFEVNNLDERYVLAAVRSDELQSLKAAGWIMAAHSTGDIQFDRMLFYGDYRTVDELYTKIESVSGDYPVLTELVVYGESYCKTSGGCETPGGEQTGGYDLLAVRVANEKVPGTSTITEGRVERGDKPVFLLLANIHAREITTPEIALRWLNLLLDQYGVDPDITWLVDHHEMWIILTANPDGHWITELGEKAAYGSYPLMHRKNFDRDANGDGMTDCNLWPSQTYSHFGVDLNRNHSFAWLAPGNTTSACSPTYSGPSAASEPETAALQDLVSALFADRRGPDLDDRAAADTSGLLLTLHNYGELVLRPWGFENTPSPNEPGLKAIGDKLASFNGYRSCRSPECLYTAHGTTDDWAYGELGIPAFTFEIGSYAHGFSPPYAVIDREQWPDNRDAFIYAALLARWPYQLIEGPDVSLLEVTEDQFDGTVTITAELSDPDQVTAARYSIDIPFWDPAAESEPLTLLSHDPIGSIATFQAPADVSDLAAGRHTVFVHGQDSAGNNGVTRSSFFEIKDPSQSVWMSTFIPFAAGQ